MHALNITVLNDVDTATISSDPIPSEYLICSSFQVVFGDTTAQGTVKIQASNDPVVPNNPPINWSDISGATVTATAGGTLLIPKFDVCYRFLRVVFTVTTPGTTTIQVNMMALYP